MTKIRTINSIEISSLCDNNCAYCPASLQHQYRKTGLMDMRTFVAAIAWVARMQKRGTQRELNLFGVGEPTLNPLLPEMISVARARLGPHQRLHMNTNGNGMTRELAIALQNAGITSIDITGHDHFVTAKTAQLFRELNISHRISHDFVTQPNNWAGQVDWLKPDYSYPCNWLRDGQVMIMSNGAVTACCIDAFGRGIFASVWDDLNIAESKPFETCLHCHHVVSDQFLKNDTEMNGGA